LCDRTIEPYLPAAFHDSGGENIGEPSGPADGMIAAMEVVAEQRHHFGAGEQTACRATRPQADALAERPASPRSSFPARECRRCQPAANTCPLESRGW